MKRELIWKISTKWEQTELIILEKEMPSLAQVKSKNNSRDLHYTYRFKSHRTWNSFHRTKLVPVR